MINLLFNILNFSLFVAVAAYLFKRYALPAISKSIIFEKLSFDGLRRQHDELKKQEKNLAESSRRQQDEYQDLTAKIMRWRAAEEKKKETALEHQQEIEQIVHQRRAQQLHDQQLLKIHMQVVPQAVEEARAELTKLFAQERSAHAYMTPILTYMRTQSEKQSERDSG